jgi:tetratricopeptide (TPR) repeat protein
VTQGQLYICAGRVVLAQSLLEEAVAISSRWDRKNPDAADALTNLALLFRLVGDRARAEPLVRKALSIYRSTLPEGSPRIAFALLELGMLARGDRKPATAGLHLGKALEMLQASFGPEHFLVAAAENDLALVAYDLGQYSRARELLVHAIAVGQKVYQGPQLQVATYLYNLAKVEEKERLRDRADLHYQQAITIYEASGSTDSPRLASALLSRAQLLKSTDKTEAKRLELRAKSLK